MRIRIQHYRQMRILFHGFHDQNFKILEIYRAERISYFIQKGNINCPYVSKLQDRSLQLSKENIHHLKQYFTFLHFLKSFSFLCVIFAHPDPDLHYQCGSGPSRPKSLRFRADPDPQHWFKSIRTNGKCSKKFYSIPVPRIRFFGTSSVDFIFFQSWAAFCMYNLMRNSTIL